jgi:homoserine kinase type II
MAILTPLSLISAQRLGGLYGLNVIGVTGLLAGSVNSSFDLELMGGQRAFLRIYEEQSHEGAAREARLLEHLSTRGVPTPRPLARTDRILEGAPVPAFVAEHKGKAVAVFPWVDGEPLCQRRVTPEKARRVGEALARVHLAGASFEGTRASRFDADALEARLANLPWATLDADVRAAATELRQTLAERRPRAPESQGVIHGDLFRDNVLWQGDSISALIDFESASRGSAAFDLCVTMLAWCYGDDLDHELMGALGRGYMSVRPLSSEDRAHLFDEAIFAATRFAITRITDYELRPRGLGVFKDYRRFLARKRTIERLGPEGLLTALGL